MTLARRVMKILKFFHLLFLALSGANYLPHCRARGAITLVNLTGYQWGVEADETGINIDSFGVTYKPEQKEFLPNRQGTKIGFAVDQPEAEISVSGEVSGSTGLMAATFSAAITIANDTEEFGMSTGGIYLDDVNIDQNRTAFRKATFKLSKNKSID